MKKHFYRHAMNIYNEWQELNENMPQCIKHIVDYINKGEYSNAYNWLMIESDKIRHTIWEQALYKYRAWDTYDWQKRYWKYHIRTGKWRSEKI